MLFDIIRQARPFLAANLKAFVTDGEKALQQALEEAFPGVVSLMCITHIERNIKQHVREKLHLSDKFVSVVVNDLTGSAAFQGLIHSRMARIKQTY